MTDTKFQKRGGRRPGAGRKKGTPNKATNELKTLAQQYTEQAVQTLSEVMTDPEAPAQARISAASALLDRGHGRPRQEVEVQAGHKLDAEMLERLKTDMMVRLEKARERQRQILIERGILLEGDNG